MRDEYPLLQRWETLGSAAEILERADREATEDPAGAVPVALEAVRVARAAGIACLESRTLAVLGFALALSGRPKLAAAVFDAATAYGCPCCLPAVERRRAFLVLDEEGPLRAVDVSREALEMANRTAPGEVALCRQTFGVMLYYAEDVGGSIRELSAVVDSLPVETPCYCGVLQNLCTALAASDDVEDIRYAVRKLQAIPDRLKGKKRLTQQRAKLAWTTGQALARLAVLDAELSIVERRAMLNEAARQLRIAVDGLKILRLPLEVAACASDCAAVLAMVNPFEVASALDFETRQLPAEVTKAQGQAREAAQAIFSPEAIAALWVALRALRKATAAAGAPAPVMPYTWR